MANLLGMFPYFPTVTSQLIITVALALVVFFMVIIAGLMRHGLHFFKLFVPSGIPVALLPLVVAIEIISFFTRPVSHSVRLFANMLAGHITVKVFAGFIFSLGTLGALGIVGAILPLIMVVGLTALEILIAFLQAYVFAMLACIYINDAIHPGH
jgi:F-type H+-transporting ATPase subunit a